MADAQADDARKTGGKAKDRHPDKKLTAVTVRRAGPGRHADGGGLYLVVDPPGARRWLLRVVAQGKRRDIGLGGVQTVSLAQAREAAQGLRAIARIGGNPLAARDKDKHAPLTFEDAARRVHAEQIVPNAKNGKHVAQWLSSLEAAAFPVMGAKPVAAIAQSDVLRVLSPIWTEKPETASRIRQRIRTVLDWARAAGFRDGINPVEGVELGLPRQKARVTHFAALPWKDLPGVIAQIAGAKGMGALALRFAILTAARSGEVRMAEWSEIDIAEKAWIIPAERMKAGLEHRVPLCDAAISVLHEAKALATRREALAFPSQKPGRPLSDMTLSAVLKRLEIPVTVHGFRSTFRDWTEEATAQPGGAEMLKMTKPGASGDTIGLGIVPASADGQKISHIAACVIMEMSHEGRPSHRRGFWQALAWRPAEPRGRRVDQHCTARPGRRPLDAPGRPAAPDEDSMSRP